MVYGLNISNKSVYSNIPDYLVTDLFRENSSHKEA